MKEIRTIVNAYDQLDKSSVKAALATVVRVEGSSYRRTGARMLVCDDGRWVGGISGGCLEGDALRRARFAIVKSQASVVTYDTTGDDTQQIGVGLGCNGIIDVLFTPLDFNNKNNPVETLKWAANGRREKTVLITFLHTIESVGGFRAGDVIEYERSKNISFVANPAVANEWSEKIESRILEKRSGQIDILLPDGALLSAFVEIIPPEIRIIIMGHEYDVLPLAKLIKEIGWSAFLVTERQKINNTLASVVNNVYGTEQFNELAIDEFSAILLMSHSFKTDKLNLIRAIGSKAFYIGVLGPKLRADKIFGELEQEGNPISQTDKDRIFAPAGLDIGATSPEEIALSLIAEIQAFSAKREGTHLKYRQRPIHDRH